MSYVYWCLGLLVFICFCGFCFCAKSCHEFFIQKNELSFSRSPENAKKNKTVICVLDLQEKNELSYSKPENAEGRERVMSVLDQPEKDKLSSSGPKNKKEKDRVISIIDLPKKDELFSSRAENANENERMFCILDLPELVLENIFERLLLADLCSMARVCSSLREKLFREIGPCDYLWEKLLERKWSKLIGNAAYRRWQSFVASRDGRPFSWTRPSLRKSSTPTTSTLPVDSILAFYLSLESGKLEFAAQIYYGENNYRGVMLVCYDAMVTYDSRANTFKARYPSLEWKGKRVTIEWDRVRAPQVDTHPYMLHVSDCLNDLKPGDHIEIQRRSQQSCAYGWWYARIGHLERCNEVDQDHCNCPYDDTIVVEFVQYSLNSKWRRKMINRKHHLQEYQDGYYGGIRKLRDEEIPKWLSFLPSPDEEE